MGDSKNRASAIRMTDVSCRREPSSAPVLSGITLDIPSGQWVGIAGRNGSGKSTLLRLLCGLLPASSGRIEIGGLLLGPETLRVIRQRIGIVFANPDNQFVGLTVAEDIVFGLENRCLPSEQIHSRLVHYAQKLEIEALLDRHPAFLSGGQKQRVAIAAVLAMEPSLVFFDEAASMLDEHARLDLLGVMRSMQKEGCYTIVSVTHDPEELLAADRAIVLEDGIIAADCSPGALFRDEALMARCRLQPPYVLEVCRALRRQGVEVGDYLNEKELLNALWPSNSNASPTVMKERIHD